MRLSADKLREDLFQVLDDVLSNGITLEVERKGHILKIISDEPSSKLSRLEPHDTIVGDPESLVSIDWIIVSHSKHRNAFLISKDGKITENYPKTIF